MNPPAPKRLFLLDAMALIYRAFYALNKNPRINSKGLNTSAILGFANTLYDIIKNEKPTHMGVAFDTMAPTVRHEDYFEYKANRQAMPEDLSIAIPYIKQLIEAFQIPVLFCEGYEADDIIGTFAKKAEMEGFDTYMVTSDKDFGQLVSEHIFMYKPGKFGEKASVLGVKEICEKFSIQRPEQIIDLLALWGDSSDNIPGIPGVGEVTAKKLLQTFGGFEQIYENLEKVENLKLRQKFIDFQRQGELSKQLATIILDVPIAFDPHQLTLKSKPTPELANLLESLELRAFSKRVFADAMAAPSLRSGQTDLFGSNEEVTKPAEPIPMFQKTIQTVDHQYVLVETAEDRYELIQKLNQLQGFCFDTETTGLDAAASELVGISFAWIEHQAYFVLLPEQYPAAFEVVQEFKAVFENPNIKKTGQNIKFDIGILLWYDISVQGVYFDTMLAQYLIDPDIRNNLNYLSESYLQYRPIPIEDLIGKSGKSQKSMREVPKEILSNYAAEDADITLQLKNILEPLLRQQQFESLLHDVEMPLVPVLASMEFEGIRIDMESLREYAKELEIEIAQLQEEIFQLAGRSFNIASPKQLGDVLFGELKIAEANKLTKTRQFSTSEDTLRKLVSKHTIVEKVLDYRSLTKLKSTYVDALPAQIRERTGRVHTSYNQALVATGRLSSNNPNLQNIPIRTARGREVRKAFVPRNSNYLLLSADYSQIELRIIAELSGDRNMLDAFMQQIDIHTATAAGVYGVSLEEVTSEMRRTAKMVNFGIIYGISPFGLSERLNIPRKEAAQIIDSYFLRYPGVKQYMDAQILFAREHRFVETILKRKRHLSGIYSQNANIRGFAERNAINAPIQGSAADMIKIAMVGIFNEFNQKKLRSRLVLQVHDELVVDAHKEEVEMVREIVKRNMEHALPMKVPIVVEMNTGQNWLEAH